MQSSTGFRLDRHKLEQMLPLLLLTVAVATALALRWVLSDYLQTKITAPSIPAAAEYRACVLWASSLVAFVVIAAWIVAVMGDWLAVHYQFAKKWMAPLLAILMAAGLSFGTAILLTLIAFVVIASLTLMIFAEALAAQRAARPRLVLFEGIAISVGLFAWLSYLSRHDSQQPSLLGKLRDVHIPVFKITAFGNTTAVVAFAMIIATSIGIIAKIQVAKDPAELRALLDPMRLLLYSSAAFLAVGVVEIYLLWDWPAHLPYPTPEMGRAIHQMAQTIATMSGTLYTLMMLVLFVPVSLMHERRSRELSSDVEKKSALSMLAELIALAGPMITAFGIPKLFLS